MNITIHRGSESLTLDLPPTSREVSVRGFRVGVDMLKTVRLDVADTSLGTPMIQGVSKPMEARGD